MTDMASLVAAVSEGGAVSMAEQLCRACAARALLDGAVLSVMTDEVSGVLGGWGAEVALVDDLSFTTQAGASVDAWRVGAPVEVDDLAKSGARAWPAYASQMQEAGVRAVFAFPVGARSAPVGVLTMWRRRAGGLTAGERDVARAAASLALVPIQELINGADIAGPAGAAQREADLNHVVRTDVAQATGMLVEQLGLDPSQAVARLRAHAYGNSMTSRAVALGILHGSLRLEDDRRSGS